VRLIRFFQVRSAEALLQVIMQQLNLQGDEVLVDAVWYWDVNLASGKSVAVCVGLEVQPEAVEQAQLNAQRNGITNVMFQVGWRNYCPNWRLRRILYCSIHQGCDRVLIETLLQSSPRRIYVSCKPATLPATSNCFVRMGNTV